MDYTILKVREWLKTKKPDYEGFVEHVKIWDKEGIPYGTADLRRLAANYGTPMPYMKIGSSGYVTQLDKAQKYTKEEILKDFSDGRETDIIWLASHVEDNIKTHIDVQYLKRDYSY
jgi:hypothetical protein